jgi:hypothetical protein
MVRLAWVALRLERKSMKADRFTVDEGPAREEGERMR